MLPAPEQCWLRDPEGERVRLGAADRRRRSVTQPGRAEL